MSKLTYIRCGDYDIPNLKLSVQPETSIGKYGRMRKSYLKEHRPTMSTKMSTIKLTEPDTRLPTKTVTTLAKLANSIGGSAVSTTQSYGVPTIPKTSTIGLGLHLHF